MSGNPFNRVGGLKPRRNAFDLSYRSNFTCDLGELIPVMCDEVIPGDTWTIANHLTIRFQPLVAPVMHEFTAHVHYWYIPYRILWDRWEDFIIQGDLQNDNIAIALPTMNPLLGVSTPNTLWDYFGMETSQMSGAGQFPAPIRNPIIFPWYAYNLVYNEYYRDQDLQSTEVPRNNPNVLRRSWRKDYFTSARPFRQKGFAPALPVTTEITAPNGDLFIRADGMWVNGGDPVLVEGGSPFGTNWPVLTPAGSDADVQMRGNIPDASNVAGPVLTGFRAGRLADEFRASSTAFDISDLRLAFQAQKWLERNARAGTRYTEFLRSHFGVAPSDARLQRPEWVGGTKMPVIISEILQTSETDATPQGNMSGHGLGSDASFAGKFFAPEYGIILGLLSVMPKPTYSTGINRQWLRRLPIDFFFPEFAHISEQAIYNMEISCRGTSLAENMDIFGYTGAFDECRIKHDITASEMRPRETSPGTWDPQLSYWNLARNFTSTPALNSNFIECNPGKRIFAVTSPDSKGLIVNCRNIVKAVRMLPLIAEPGLVDHF